MNKKRLSLSLQTEVIDGHGILHGVTTEKRVKVYGEEKKLRWLFNSLADDLAHTVGLVEIVKE